jgi:predicted Zn-dependent protease
VSGFSPDQAELIRVGLAIRLAERQKDGARLADLWRRMAQIAEKSPANFYRADRELLIARARAFVGGPAPGVATRRSADKAEIEAALAAAEAGDRAGAISRFEALLAKHPDDAWLKRAALAVYIRAGALTRAGALVDTPEERDRLSQRRRFYGLPPDAARFGVTAEREPDYVAAFDAAYEAFTASDDKALRKQAAAALKRFPGAPGLLALACAADFLGHRAAAARTRCRAALAAWDETVLAHFFAGQIEPGEEGRRHLRRALELDPSQEAVIQRLLDAPR